MNRVPAIVFSAYALLVILAHAAGTVFPTSTTWGFHHLGFLPVPFAVGILGAMILLLIPSVQEILRVGAERIAGASRSRPGRGIPGAVVAIILGVALEVTARERTFFLGDGYLVTRDLGAVTRLAAIPAVFYSSPLAGLIAWRLMQLWHLAGVNEPARLAWQSLSVLSGPAFACAAWRLSLLCSPDMVRRLLFFFTILLGGWAQLFFGYVETYPPLAFLMLTYIWLSVEFLHGERRLWLPTAVFAVMVVTHVSTLLLTPSLAVLFFHALRRGSTRDLLASAVGGGALFVLLLYLCGTSPAGFWHILMMGKDSLLPIVPGDNYFVAFGLLSGWHMANLLNAVLLLFPLFPAIGFIVIGDAAGRRDRFSPAALFAIIFAFCAGAWCVLFNFVLGMSRDWDVVAPYFMGISVFVTYAWYRRAPDSVQTGRLMILALCLTALHTIGWIAVNAGAETSLRRAEILPDERQWARWSLAYTYEDLGSFYRKAGDLPKAEHYTRAMAEVDSTNGRRWTSLGYLLDIEGKPDEAIGAYRRGMGHGATDKATFHSLAIALYRTGRTDEAIEVYRQRLEIDPKDTIAALNMGLFYQQAKADHIAAVKCFLAAAAIDSTLPDTYRALGDSYRALGRESEAGASYGRYQSLSGNARRNEHAP
jgi:tetratricopeptide (TPR) repeat protein